MQCLSLLSLFICIALSASQETIPSFKLPLQRRKIGTSAVQSSVFQWDAKATIGGQNVTLQLDTGSSFLWVLDPALSAVNSSTRGTYDFTKSRTANSLNETFVIGYGGGVVKGRMITETVTIGGLTFSNVPMGIANSTSPYFLGEPFIGLLGLGPQPTYAHALPAPFSTSQMQSFALDFSDHAASIQFGGTDRSKYAGRLAGAPLNDSDGHWAIDGVDFSVGGRRINTSSHVVLDTGAGHNIVAPASVTEAYYSLVPGAFVDQLGHGVTVWLVPCTARLPTLTLHIGPRDRTATVAGASMIGDPVVASAGGALSGYCNPSVQNATGPEWLGFPFFRSNYVVVERGRREVWWAGYG